MGIEGGSNSEVQNQEINQANNEQNEINQAEHQRSGEELEGNSTIDNEGERKQIEGKDDATESAEEESSQLDKEDNIEDDPNTEQPPESDNVAPEQQLDNQDTIESEPSGADEMGEDNNETVDSLDNDDEIEDSEDLDDNQDSTEGDIQDSLDTEDSIDSDDTDDSVEEDDNNEQDPLDAEDSIEDDGEESENPEGEDDIENTEGGDTETIEGEEESENPEGDDTENPEREEESENSEGDDTEKPEGEKESENPERGEDTENPEDNEKTENSEGEDTDNPEGEEESENPEGDDAEDPEGEDTDNPKDNEETENPKDNNESEKPEDFVAKDANDSNESDNDSVKGEVSDELKNALEPFEQSNWDNMSPEQQKEAVSALRDSVADDLGLQEKPDVKYYNNDDDTDFGGYSPSENAIYINEHNMGDAKETADTIAHESRHCWQHEIADNSDSPQAQAFKENFDDYIRPEDDYRGYRNQPVEADAREYANNITDNIPDQKIIGDENVVGAPSDANATSNDIRQNQEEKGAVFDGKSEIPSDLESKSGEFESKIKEPDEYASKFEYDTQQKLENYYKEDGGNLSDSQKQDLVSDLKNSYDSADVGDRGDVLVPENSKDVTGVYYNGKIGKYDVGYDWKPVDTVPETRTMEVMKEGQQFDRVGPPSGRCTGAVGEDGSCATVKERSIPYHFTEDDITKETSYHRYQAEQDFTKENLANAIDNSMYSDDKKAEMHANLDRYYENAQAKGYGDGDGLATGEIAPMFEDTTGATGGGKQYDMPLSMEELENIGMISEVEKGTY